MAFPLSSALAAGLLLAAPLAAAATLDHYLSTAPFPMPALAAPTFPDRQFPLTDFAAVPDGRSLNTDAFARAIEACARAGGGHVIVPSGLWLTGPIVLRSRVDLHLERGAVIQFTADHSVYPLVPREGRGFSAQSPLSARDQSGFALTGEGILDGAGDSWRPVRRSKMTAEQWQTLLRRGGAVSGPGGGTDWWPSTAAMQGEDFLADLSRTTLHPTAADALPARDFLRPPLLTLTRCRDILIDGVTLRNSPAGLFSPDACTGLVISNATFFNEWWAQNGDGMDINNCRGVAVFRCTLSTGDDAICMKAGGRPAPSGEAALQDVVVAECTVYHGHGGFVVGGTTETGMRHLWCTHCTFLGTDAGIRVKSGRGHGGLVRDVTVDHIVMEGIVGDAISFNTFYDNTPVSAARTKTVLSRDPARTPEFRDFLLQDIVCRGAGTAIALTGLEERPLHAITIERADLTARRGFTATDAADIELRQVVLHAAEGPLVTQRRTRDVRIDN